MPRWPLIGRSTQVKALVRVILIGCGGHASDVLSVVEACNEVQPQYSVVGYLDDCPGADGRRVTTRGVKRLGGLDGAARVDGFYVLGIGYPEGRFRVAMRIKGSGQLAEPIIHPRAGLSTGVTLEAGVVILGAADIGPAARISEGAMVGRGVVVGHDTVVAEYVSLMPGAVVSGDCSIGGGALIGTNATVLEGRVIGEWSRLGAGAVLTEDLPARCTAVGAPARIVSSGP